MSVTAPEATPDRDEFPLAPFLGVLLRWGLIIASATVMAGAVLYLVKYGGTAPSYRAFGGEPSDLETGSGILRGVAALRGRSLIQFGLLLLVATPVARVAACVVLFALRRDRLYVVLSAIVLVLLCLSLTGTIR